MKKILILLISFLSPIIQMEAKPMTDFTITRFDDDGDGYKETFVYSHNGKRAGFKQCYDYTQDGKPDVCLLLDENSGAEGTIEINRETWPVVKAVTTIEWRETKRKNAIKFWEKPENKNRPSGTCDISNESVLHGEGYLITSAELLSSNVYVSKRFFSNLEHDNMKLLHPDMDDNQLILNRFRSWFVRGSATDWFISSNSMDLLFPPAK